MTNVPLNLFSSRWPSFFWEFGSTNQRIRRNSSQVVSYSEERKEWVFNAGKGSGRLRETSETLIFNNDNQKHHKERTFVTIICGPRSAEEVIPWEAGNFWAFANKDAPEGNKAIHIWCNELKQSGLVDFEFQRWLNVLLREDQFVRPLPMWQTRRRKILSGDVVGWNLKWKLSCLSRISTTSAVSSDFIVSKSLRHFQLTMSRLDWLCDPPFFFNLDPQCPQWSAKTFGPVSNHLRCSMRFFTVHRMYSLLMLRGHGWPHPVRSGLEFGIVDVISRQTRHQADQSDKSRNKNATKIELRWKDKEMSHIGSKYRHPTFVTWECFPCRKYFPKASGTAVVATSEHESRWQKGLEA